MNELRELIAVAAEHNVSIFIITETWLKNRH